MATPLAVAQPNSMLLKGFMVEAWRRLGRSEEDIVRVLQEMEPEYGASRKQGIGFYGTVTPLLGLTMEETIQEYVSAHIKWGPHWMVVQSVHRHICGIPMPNV